jgi:hypothetical protein
MPNRTKELHPPKAYLPIDLTLHGKSTSNKLEHSQNASQPSSLSDDFEACSMVSEASPVQWRNAACPMTRTELGSTNSLSSTHDRNAPAEITASDDGCPNATEDNIAHQQKAICPIHLTDAGNRMACN